MFGMQNINKANPSPLLAKPGCKKKRKKQVRQKAQPISSPEEFVNTWLFSVREYWLIYNQSWKLHCIRVKPYVPHELSGFRTAWQRGTQGQQHAGSFASFRSKCKSAATLTASNTFHNKHPRQKSELKVGHLSHWDDTNGYVNISLSQKSPSGYIKWKVDSK